MKFATLPKSYSSVDVFHAFSIKQMVPITQTSHLEKINYLKNILDETLRQMGQLKPKLTLL